MEVVNLFCNGGCDFFAIIKYIFMQYWLHKLQFNQTLNGALKVLMKKKSEFTRLWNIFYIEAMKILMDSQTKNILKSNLYKMVLGRLTDINKFINIYLVKLINASNWDNVIFWQHVALVFKINLWRKRKQIPILRWTSSEFEHQLKMESQDRISALRALDTLPDQVKELFVRPEKDASTLPDNNHSNKKSYIKSGDGVTGDVTCYWCDKSGHIKPRCPDYLKQQKQDLQRKLQEEKRKNKSSRGRGRYQGGRNDYYNSRNSYNNNGYYNSGFNNI